MTRGHVSPASRPVLGAWILAGVVLWGCEKSARTGTLAVAVSAPSRSPLAFADVTREAGIEFAHSHGGSGTHYYVETMTAGAAFLDYDGDGWLDIYLLQGAWLPGSTPSRALRNTLYRNSGDGTFVDVTERAGVGDAGYGMGVCWGDYDNDGDPDIFLANLGSAVMYRNNGDGTFTDVSSETRIEVAAMCTSPAFVDYDHDGWLDIFLCRYMDYDLETNPRCKDHLQRPAYCSPNVYEGTHSLLFRNERDGTFTDVSERSGIARSRARAMGVVCADYDGDGWIDIYVSSDLMPNLLFLNNRDGTFREEALFTGVAYGPDGAAQAGMGIDCGDYDNDGLLDLVVTNFEHETNALYRNLGGGTYQDESFPAGIAKASLPYVGWGVRFVDIDLDGFEDLFVVNGHVDDYADERGGAGYAQRALVFHNRGDGTFADVTAGSGEFFSRRVGGRGMAIGDYDNDGDSDVLIACNNQPAVLLRNDSPRDTSWIRVVPAGRGCNRDAIGARVRVSADSRTQTRYVRSGTSYLADHDRRLVFGIGRDPRATVEITWPCGAVEKLEVEAGKSAPVRETGCKVAPGLARGPR